MLALLALLVALPCFSLFWIEVGSLRAATEGIHEWRQGWTFSVAYAFLVEDDATFFFPKHAWRAHQSGFVGMEPPIYPWVVAQAMRLFGDAPSVGRVINFALFVLAFTTTVVHFGRRVGFSMGLGYFVMAAFSPIALCEFRQVQPDPAMTSLCMLAAVCLHQHGETGSRSSFGWGLLLFTIGLLTKPIAVCAAPAMFLFTVMGAKRPGWAGFFLRGAAFLLPLALMVGWDKWSNALVQRFQEGHSVISIEHNPAEMWENIKNVAHRRNILLGLIESYATHVALFPAVLLGIPWSLRRETRSWAVPYLAWLFGITLISLSFAHRYYTNWYYMLLYGPPIWFFGANALSALFEVVALQTREIAPRAVALGAVVAALLVGYFTLGELPWDRIEYVEHQLAVHVRRAVGGTDLYWIAISLAMVAAASLLPLRDLLGRAPRLLFAVPLAVGAGYGMIVPYQDTKQTARFYTSELVWETSRTDSKEIVAAVNRYSTYRDKFLMNGANPGLLARARRVGYADEPDWIDRMGRVAYQNQGVRFFMTFHDSRFFPATMHGSQLLERGARWELYCIDPKGCPRRTAR